MIDIDVEESAWHDRLKGEIGELVTVESAESLDEARIESVRTPAVFTLIRIQAPAGRVIVGSKAKRERWEFRAGIIAESLRSKQDAVRVARRIAQSVKRASDGWRPPGAQKGLDYLNTEYAGRVGNRVLYEVEFETHYYETYE